MRLSLGLILATTGLAATAPTVMGDEIGSRYPGRAQPLRPVELRSRPPVRGGNAIELGKAVGDTTMIAFFDYDGAGGVPDPQGWVSVDATDLSPSFHVDDFADVSGYSPLAGTKSLWCGVGVGEPGYTTAPGYGDFWFEVFESVDFEVIGDAEVQFSIAYDVEPTFDSVFLQYRSAAGWVDVANYSGSGFSSPSLYTITQAEHQGTIRLRFVVSSDNSRSDEDGVYDSAGAVLLDDLTISDDGGVVDFQNFESEPAGALGTADGNWSATGGFGNFTELFDGSTVLQEDPGYLNETNFWGCFDGSLDSYDCGAMPQQPAVPLPMQIPGPPNRQQWVSNEIRSPWIDLTVDINGDPYAVADRFWLEFDVYRDLPLENRVFFSYAVRFRNGGIPTSWRASDLIFYGDSKEWTRFARSLQPLFEPGATEIQVAIQIVDMCWLFGDCDSPTLCHTHGPLIDNVMVRHIDDVFIVWNRDPSGPGSFSQALSDAASWPGFDTIYFYETGSFLTTTGWDVGDDVAVYGFDSHSGGQPVPLAFLDGQQNAVSGLRLGSNSLVHGLAIGSFGLAGVQINGDGNVLEHNYIGLSGDETPQPNGIGVELIGTSSNNVLGRSDDGSGNRIEQNLQEGVVLRASAGTGNAIRGNSIDANGALGIDLEPIGVDPNDPLDADGGPNGGQNSPTLTLALGETDAIEGVLESAPNESIEIDFYRAIACDGSGFGEGGLHLGSTAVATDPQGMAAIAWASAFDLTVGDFVSAIATDAAGNSSEFSACIPVAGSTIVTSTADAGPGTLRDALLAADLLPGHQTVSFNIPSAGPHRIELDSALEVPGETALDARTQPGWVDDPIVEIAPSPSSIADEGLSVAGDGVELRGLSITGFPVQGIVVEANDVTIQGCFVGVDPLGVVNGNGTVGILVSEGSNVRIGGVGQGEGNVIAGSAGPASAVSGAIGAIGDYTRFVSFRGNHTFDNAGLPFDLGNDGITINDIGDVDDGPNAYLNFPEVDGSSGDATTAYVLGTLGAEPITSYEIDVYGSAQDDPETDQYLGNFSIVTNEAGEIGFSKTLPAAGPFYTYRLIATDQLGNSSELGAVIYPYSSIVRVTKALPSGAGSLVDAVSTAPDESAILFDIPGPGPHTIALMSPLLVAGELILDAFTQTGAIPNSRPLQAGSDAVYQIVLDGTGSAGDGVVVSAEARLRGFVIQNFPGTGVLMDLVTMGPFFTARVDGCRIGTDIVGATARGNGVGIRLQGTPPLLALIGGRFPDSRVLVSGNQGAGIHVDGLGALSNNAFVGTDASGALPLGNGGHGVLNDLGFVSLERSRIGFNTLDGAALHSRSYLTQTTFISNAGLAIDLMDDGVSQNDPGDGDVGPNGMQNYPVVTSVDLSMEQLTAQLATLPNRSYTVEFFASAACDQSGHGEGERYLGGSTIVTDGAGDAVVVAGFSGPIFGGDFITATATDFLTKESSEFSPCFELLNTPAGAGVAVSPFDPSTGTQPISVQFAQVTTAGNTTLSISDTGPAPPSGFSFGDPPVYYELQTNASYVAPIQICISYDETSIGGAESDLVLYHYDVDLSMWVDATTSIDEDEDLLCGHVDSLSPFAVGWVDLLSAVPDSGPPRGLALHPAVPNPFNPSTMLAFDVPAGGARVTIDIYDVAGRHVRRLVDEHFEAGRWSATWRGRDDRGNPVGTGVYLARLVAGETFFARKLVLIK